LVAGAGLRSDTRAGERGMSGGAAAATGADRATDPEVSVVMPCLDEADTVAACVGKALRALEAGGIAGEVIVADNGSSDGSPELARQAGARVVSVTRRGYGSALMGGIAAARGRFVIMGDADDSYDFGEVPRFVSKLREGYEIVQGCRLPAGGGRVLPGAMPLLHRILGNPFFSLLTRWWFHVPIHDVYCGLRGFSKQAYQRLDQRCTGMEFATEMILKGARFDLRLAEVPVTLHRDGRHAHRPHLKTFPDGWRTLRFYLMYSPKWLFLQPGLALIAAGLAGYGLALPGVRLAGVHFSLNTLIVASLALLVGFQSVFFALGTKTFAIREGFVPADRRIEWFHRVFPLERGLLAGGLAVLMGLALITAALAQWWRAGFGDLDYEDTSRWVIPGATLTALGVQTVFASFFLSILNMLRK
jgi:glycosyltransferase involved in cell wall biosynthesis